MGTFGQWVGEVLGPTGPWNLAQPPAVSPIPQYSGRGLHMYMFYLGACDPQGRGCRPGEALSNWEGLGGRRHASPVEAALNEPHPSLPFLLLPIRNLP